MLRCSSWVLTSCGPHSSQEVQRETHQPSQPSLYLCLLPLPSLENNYVWDQESLGLGWALDFTGSATSGVENALHGLCPGQGHLHGLSLPFWTMRWLLWFSGHVQSCWQVVCSCTWVIKSSIIRKACLQGHLQPEVFLRSQQSRWFYRMLFGLQHTFLVQEFIHMYKGLVEHLSRARHCSRWRYIRQIKPLLAQSLRSSGEGRNKNTTLGLNMRFALANGMYVWLNHTDSILSVPS